MTFILDSARFASGVFNPLSIGWAHAYWTEGPEFIALGLADGATVSTWPDEIATANLTQSTSGQRPLYDSSSPTFANRPVIVFDGTDDWMETGSYTNLAEPNALYVVFRLTNGADLNFHVIANTTTGVANAGVVGTGNTGKWRIGGTSSSAESAGTADTTVHALRANLENFAEKLWLDEVQIVNATANIGSAASTKIVVGDFNNGGGWQTNMEIAFLGIKDAVLTSQEISDLHTWAQNLYGVA